MGKLEERAFDRAGTRPVTMDDVGRKRVRCEICNAVFHHEAAVTMLANHYLEKHAAILAPAFIAICPKCGTEFPIR